MSVKIRLKRLGKIRQPQYRVVVMDSRTKRNGRAIEEIGTYHPKEHPSLIDIDSARAQYWLGVGAQPTEQVAALLRVTGDWQQFKGEPGAEGTLQKPEAKPDKKTLYEAALKSAQGDAPAEGGASKKAAKKAETPKADKPKAEKPKAEPDVTAQEPQVDEAQAAAEEPAADSTDAADDKA